MRLKKMLPYWILSPILLGCLCITSISVASLYGYISTRVSPEAVAASMIPNIISLSVTMGFIVSSQIIIAVIHLVNYWHYEFENNDSKITHALYQLFFGLGVVGLIIVFVRQ